MQEKIVYFLGAGFSAPLGLPVMSNFLIRSKDLYFSRPKEFPHFERVFRTLDGMGKAKNYYAVDLFNIEEVLSLLEMEDYAGTTAHRDAYLIYLKDVITSLTPPFEPKRQREGDPWDPQIFSPNPLTSDYTSFVASLLGLAWIRPTDDPGFYSIERAEGCPQYSVITLNYDLVIENALSLLRQQTGAANLGFSRSLKEAEDLSLLPLAKLHGSVDPLTIVPPTWNKVGNDDVKEAWKLAYQLLADATQIRFLGYSLPITDTYVRYLLGAAVLGSKHLKQIDVICLDDKGETIRKRFMTLTTFYRFRFASGDIAKYLSANRQSIEKHARRRGSELVRSFDRLEDKHESFMNSSHAP